LETTYSQFKALPKIKRNAILRYLRSRPYYRYVTVTGRRFILVHAGFDAGVPMARQEPHELVWMRDEFFCAPARKTHITVFGHTPSFHICGDGNSAPWIDMTFRDKIGIDGGCIYGGTLNALRLDDGAMFHVRSTRPHKKLHYTAAPMPPAFWDEKRLSRVSVHRSERKSIPSATTESAVS
jgi:serine/threonine protein phosphatase 1